MTGIIASMVGATYGSGAPITAVTFDGTGDYYEKTSITSTATSATKFVVALTYNTNTTSGQTHMINMYSVGSTTYGFYIWINSGRSQLVVTQGTTGSEVYNVYTGTTTVTTGAWENIVWYFDMASFANTKCYKNGVSQSLTQASFNGTLSLNFNSISQIKIGQKNTAQTATGSDYNGKIAQVYVNAVTAEPDINLFWNTASNLPQDLGINGTASGLPQPYVYHYGNTSTFITNNGTGFASYSFTANGNVANTTGPTYPTTRTAKTITAVGNAQISTAQSVFGGASALFDGTADYLNVTGFESVNTFTFESRIRFIALPTAGNFHMLVGTSSTQYFGLANIGGTYFWEVSVITSGQAQYVHRWTTTGIATNTWYHVAVQKTGTTVSCYQDGTSRSTSTSFNTLTSAMTLIDSSTFLGSWSNTGYTVNGYMDEMRYSNVVRYSANFTVPTAPFSNDTNTLLLIHANGNNGSTIFTDDVASNTRTARTLTAVGNAQVSTAQSVFGGASALFDGTGDSLSISPFALTDRSSNFTLEARVRLSTLPSNNTFRMIYGEIQTYYAYASIANRGGVYTSNIVVRAPDGVSFREEYMTISSIAANTWYHWAIEKDGATLNHYWNGTKLTTANFTQGTMAASYGFNNLDVIGRWNADTNNWNGNLDEMRVSNIARYGANFTVPTAPFVNDANTVLLLHMNGTNGSTTFTDDNG